MCEISVCEECLLIHANGEGDPERPAELPDAWSLIRFAETVTMGGEHNDGCPNGIDGPPDTDCDCDNLGFSWSSCEGCGDTHGGDRFKFTLWQARTETARAAHARCLTLARQADTREAAFGMLGVAAQWRGYLARRYAEQAETARWIAARRAA